MLIFMNTFRERFAEEVERLGVTNLAKVMAVARNTIYNWAAKGNVPLAALEEMATHGLDISYVVKGEMSDSSLSADERELVLLYRSANVSLKAAAVAALGSGSSTSGPSVGQQFNSKVKGKYAGANVGAVHEKAPKEITIKQRFKTDKKER